MGGSLILFYIHREHPIQYECGCPSLKGIRQAKSEERVQHPEGTERCADDDKGDENDDGEFRHGYSVEVMTVI